MPVSCADFLVYRKIGHTIGLLGVQSVVKSKVNSLLTFGLTVIFYDSETILQ
jgi:hypothetical protein